MIEIKTITLILFLPIIFEIVLVTIIGSLIKNPEEFPEFFGKTMTILIIINLLVIYFML